MILNSKLLVLIVGSLVAINSLKALAEDPEPVDKNNSGVYVNLGFSIGQVYGSGLSTPGIAALYFVEPGYTSAYSAWNRMETSIEFFGGQFNFKKKDDAINTTIEMPIDGGFLAKFGYGYSIGGHSFAIIRAGAGPVFTHFKQKVEDPTTGESTTRFSKSLTGFAGSVGIDGIFPMNDVLQILGGFSYKYMSFSGSNIESFQLNIPMLTLGARFQF